MTIEVIFDLINRATKPLQEINSNVRKLTATLGGMTERMMKLNQSVELFDRMGQTVTQLSQPYRDFEQSMADVSAITGIVGADLDRLGKVARQTGVESGLGAVGAVDAFKLLASQIQVDDIGMDGLITLQKKSITLAQASGMTMTEAANSLAGTINQFGLQATEANRVINVLAAGSKYGAAEIPELAQSFKVVGAAANAAGLSVEGTAGALEVLSKNNLKGAEAGTALRNILLKMQTEMGIDFNKTSLAEALTKLKPKYKDAAYMSKLFGMENVAAAQFLVANAETVEEMTDKVTGTATATEQAAIETDTWNHRLKVQAARFNEWSMRLTETAPGIMNFIQVTSQGLGMLTSLSPLFAGIVTGIKGIIGVAGGIVGGIGKIAKAGHLMNAAMNAGKLSTYTELIKRYGTAGRIAAAGIWLKNGAAAVWNGIGAAANAITSRAFWLNLRHAAATKLSALWTAVCSKAQLIASAVTSLWSKRTALATLIQGGLTKALRLAKAALLTGLIPALGGAITTTWAWTAALLANPITWIVLAIGALIAAVVVCWQKFAEFRAVILTMWDAIKGFGQAIFEWMVAPFKMAWEIVGGIGKAIGALFSGDFSGAWDSLKEGFSGAVDAFGNPIKTVIETTQSISGNYDRHLGEERAKQAEKEQAKTVQETVPGGASGWNGGNVLGEGMPQISGFNGMDGMNPPALPVSNLAGTQDHLQSTAPNVSVDYNPTINISSEMTQKSKDDLMKTLRDNAAQFARIIQDEMRRSERGSYGLS